MSQGKSSRGAKGAKPAKAAKPARASSRSSASRAIPAQRGGGRGVYVQQPKSDVFVVLLGVALGAMFLGCLFLALRLNSFGFDISAGT